MVKTLVVALWNIAFFVIYHWILKEQWNITQTVKLTKTVPGMIPAVNILIHVYVRLEESVQEQTLEMDKKISTENKN